MKNLEKIVKVCLLSVLFIGCATKSEIYQESQQTKMPSVEDLQTENLVLNKLYNRVFDKDGNTPTIEQLDKEYYLVFFGGDWCPYCKKRKDLIKVFYEEFTAKKGNFEMILAGSVKDKSNDDLVKYMQNEDFPFYYVHFDYKDNVGFFDLQEVKECENFYVPAMILLDSKGNVLANSNSKLKDNYDFMRPIETYLRMN